MILKAAAFGEQDRHRLRGVAHTAAAQRDDGVQRSPGEVLRDPFRVGDRCVASDRFVDHDGLDTCQREPHQIVASSGLHR